MSDPAHDMAERLHTGKAGVRNVAGNWMCTCPAHPDKNPSLGIRWLNGRIVYRCFAGCQFVEIAKQVRRLGYDPTNGERLTDRSGKEIPAQKLAPVRAVTAEVEEMERRFQRDYAYDPMGAGDWTTHRLAFEEERPNSTLTRYVYRSVDGHPMMTVSRIDTTEENGRRHKDMVPISPWRQRANGRIYFPQRTMPPPRVPYGLERLALPGPVVSVEGEKCADVLFAFLGGRIAVFSVYGSTPEKADLTALAGRTIVNMADIDSAGRNYRDRMTAALGDSVVHVTSPWRGASNARPPKGWDIADEIVGKDGLVAPITRKEFVTHLARQRRQIVRPDHDRMLKEAIAAIKAATEEGV